MPTPAIKLLNQLIETSKDGEYGFASCAEQAKGADLRLLLTNRASDCQQAANELQQLVVQMGGRAEDSGSTGGAMHRGWVALRSKLSSYTDDAVLEEAERGEGVALKRYRDAVADTALTGAARTLVERQYDGVKRNHAQVRTLRDRARSAAAH